MADNIELNLGSGGAVVAADDVSSVWYQRVKLTAGGADAAAYAATPYYYLSGTNGTNQDATAVKASAGIVYSLVVTNTNTAARYFRLYNLASGATSASTPVQTYAVPGIGGIALNFTNGLDFSTGISFRLTTGSAVNDANAVAAGEIVVNLGYV